MRISLVAALGVAAGLLAGPAIAATTSTHHHHRHHAMKSHMSARHRAHGTMASNPGVQNGAVEQLNNMSLQAAQRGQNFAPPGAGNVPHSGGMRR